MPSNKKAVDIVKAFNNIEAVKGDIHAVRSGVVNEFSKLSNLILE